MEVWKEGDPVFVRYGGTEVGRVLSAEEARVLNAGAALPWANAHYVKSAEVIHYFDECSALPWTKGLARTIRDTTCTACLLDRAHQLRGWRWDEPLNREEVAFLVDKLGPEINLLAFAEGGPRWRPSPFIDMTEPQK